jgi:polyvinyl alcohol dehydrogenase (cytochrome)
MSIRTRTIVLVWSLGAWGCGGPVDEASQGVGATKEALHEHEDDAGNKDWRTASYDETGSGNNTKENRLSRRNVGSLEVKWTFDTASAGEQVAPIHATPVVARGKTYVGSFGGTFYAIGEDGDLRWKFQTGPTGSLLVPFFGPQSPIVGSAVLPDREATVVFGDSDGRIYKLDQETGELLWEVDLDAHDLGGVWGNSLSIARNTVYVGLGSFEPSAPFFPGRTCCSHRGAVVALDLATGATRWRFESIPESAQGPLPQALVDQLGGFETFGPSGGDVWSQPTLDDETNTLYVGTGQLFSRAADGSGPPTHDAVIALDARTGTPKWVRHLSNNLDVFRFDIPFHDVATGNFYDKDVADQPKVYRLNGRKVVGAGQKNGEYHVLDARTGQVIATTRHADMITGEGGLQSGGAIDGQTPFEHGTTTPTDPAAPFDGVVMALSGSGATEKWKIRIPGSSLYGGLATANGVLYFQSPFEEPLASPGNPSTWALYAVDAGTGAVLKRLAFPGRAVNGPAVSRGRVYAGFGGAFVFGPATPSPEGGVVCLGLPGGH